ncbi:unnamed protein product [Pseudo-nitzschia multistriata]|uniref:SET domain-containing protein n=1 Tax=Pseudo-nitzschia multistriata TaxID=183589 RepID=A0A448Z7M6_9STRA|nr:unnamed protein product [Pseudo-nitzschia multistriata]
MKFSTVAILGLIVSTASAFTSVSRPNRAPFSTSLGLVETGEYVDRDVYTFDEWATSCGVQKCAGFQITTQDGSDFFAVTDQDLPAGTPIVYVPPELVLSSNRAQEEFGQSLQYAEDRIKEGGVANQIPIFRLGVKILAEWEKGEQSPWYYWLNSMPRIFMNGVSMTSACFDALPPYAGWLAMKERANFVNFKKALLSAPLNEQTVTNEELVKWAYNVALTRSYSLSSSCRRIAPMVDYFNHASEPNLDIQYDDYACTVYASRDIAAGEALTISLGTGTNPSPLFATYGFLDESSPGTFCKLMDLQDDMPDMKLGFKDLLFYKNGEIAPEVYDLVLYSILKTDPNFELGPFFDACMAGDEDTKNAYHSQYFSYTLEYLKNHVDNTLVELDRLSNMAASYDPNAHPRAPLILQHNAFVKQTFEAVKYNLDSM